MREAWNPHEVLIITQAARSSSIWDLTSASVLPLRAERSFRSVNELDLLIEEDLLDGLVLSMWEPASSAPTTQVGRRQLT